MAKTQTRGIELSRRAMPVQPVAVDDLAGTFPMIIATETPVRTSIPDPSRPDDPTALLVVDEVLLAEGLDFSRVPFMPLMDNHMTERGLDASLGRVDDVRVEGSQVLGTGVFAPSRLHIAKDMKAGFFRQISAGFAVNAYEITEREGDVPLAVATSWTLHEASIVPVGADPNAIAGTRSKELYPMPTFTRKRAARSKPRKQERTQMDEDQISDLVDAAEDAVDAVTAAIEDASDNDVEVSDDLMARARGLRKFRAKRKSARAEGDEEDADKAPEEKARGKRKARADEDDDADVEAQLEEQLRKLRAKRKSARAEGDEDNTDELTPEEEADADQAVRTAKRASDELGTFAKVLRANGAKGPQIRKAVLRELTKGGARSVNNADVRVAERSAPTDTASRAARAFAKLNQR